MKATKDFAMNNFKLRALRDLGGEILFPLWLRLCRAGFFKENRPFYYQPANASRFD